jgi:hypothetical protein
MENKGFAVCRKPKLTAKVVYAVCPSGKLTAKSGSTARLQIVNICAVIFTARFKILNICVPIFAAMWEIANSKVCHA